MLVSQSSFSLCALGENSVSHKTHNSVINKRCNVSKDNSEWTQNRGARLMSSISDRPLSKQPFSRALTESLRSPFIPGFTIFQEQRLGRSYLVWQSYLVFNRLTSSHIPLLLSRHFDMWRTSKVLKVHGRSCTATAPPGEGVLTCDGLRKS